MLLRARTRPRAVRILLIGLIAAAVAGGAVAWLLRYQPLHQVGDLQASSDLQVVLVEEFEGSGAHIAQYVDGGYVTYAFVVRNAGPVAVTVTDVPLPPQAQRRLLQPVGAGLAGEQDVPDARSMRAFAPFRLGAGERQQVVIHARFDNCEYYTERAIEMIDTQHVAFRVAGMARTATVAFERPLLVRSPTIQRCSERTLDRSEHRRTAPGG